MTKSANPSRPQKHELPGELLEEIQHTGELLGDIWHLAHQGSDTSALESQLRTLLTAILEKLAAFPAVSVSTVERKISGAIWQHSATSSTFITDALPTIRQSLDRIPGLNFLLIFHPGGYVREAALEATTGPLPGAFLVAAIRWRQNDWAKSVRLAAQHCADRCFPVTSAGIVAHALYWQISVEESWGRWSNDDSATQADFLRTLRVRPELIPALAGIMIGSVTGPTSRLLSIALLRGPELEPYLLEIAAAAAQPSVRAAAYRMMLEGRIRRHMGKFRRNRLSFFARRSGDPLPADFEERQLQQSFDREKALDASAADPSPAIRKIAVAEIIHLRRYDAHAHRLAARLIADPSPAVRERAEFILTREVAAEVSS